MDEMMISVNTQIQRAISDAISNQMLPQIQNFLKGGSGHLTQNRWNVPAERQEVNPEDYHSEKTKNNFTSELSRNCFLDNRQEQAYDMVTGVGYEPMHPKTLSFSRDECHQEIISTNPVMTSIPNSTECK